MIKKGFSAKKKFEQNPEVEKNMLIPAVLISEETSNTKVGWILLTWSVHRRARRSMWLERRELLKGETDQITNGLIHQPKSFDFSSK